MEKPIKEVTNVQGTSVVLSKADLEHPDVLMAYFEKVAKFKESGEEFVVNLDEVWPLVYSQKGKAVRELKAGYDEGKDYCLLSQNGKQFNFSQNGRNSKRGGHNKETYMLSTNCLEHFIARKVRAVFDVYSKIFHERIQEEKNPDLIADRYIKTYRQKGKDDAWIKNRLDGRLARNHFTSTLAKHGVEREGYRNCTNAIYAPLFGGTTEVVRQKKGLEKKQSIRDNLSPMELTAIQFAEMMAAQNIEAQNLTGNAQCEMASIQAARATASAINQSKKSIGG
ncbi:hypothetical protein [Salmonirosea aquatica]|uniref:Uncharacterized protein n=1 Tax=Salmonirosea aquatica TaxID=2654236 RepID=A0A7C9FQA7_9BACT|nr:hypothetical protein [Cytophagaceae bacterium SJW1-29]